jgi:hypothetical protein
MQRIDGEHLKHNCMKLGCLPKHWDKEKLRARFFKLIQAFTYQEMENEVTAQTIVRAMLNIKKELENARG